MKEKTATGIRVVVPSPDVEATHEIAIWDEISCEWGTVQVTGITAATTGDQINRAIEMWEVGQIDEDGPEWTVKAEARVGDLMLVDSRSSRGHRSILVVRPI